MARPTANGGTMPPTITAASGPVAALRGRHGKEIRRFVDRTAHIEGHHGAQHQAKTSLLPMPRLLNRVVKALLSQVAGGPTT